MALTGVTYTKTASYLPVNATAPSYSWTITGGTISAGATSATVTYSFNTIGTQTLDLSVFNTCSTVTNSASYTVCYPIAGFTIAGATSVTQNSTGTYTAFAILGGSPQGHVWSVTGAGTSIVSGQGTDSVVIQFGNTGNAVITVVTEDCDGNDYTATLTVDQTQASCVALTSCSIS